MVLEGKKKGITAVEKWFSPLSGQRKTSAQKHVTVLDLPSYSLDLAPCDFFLYPKIKLCPISEEENDSTSKSTNRRRPAADLNTEVWRSRKGKTEMFFFLHEKFNNSISLVNL